jgi:uncharacterized GH25 family protein
MRSHFLALAVLLAGTAGANAHGAWVAQRHGDLAVVYGHGAGDDAYKPEKVTAAKAATAAGEAREVRIVPQAKNALLDVPKDAATLTVVFDNGFWTKGADGKYVNKGKRDVPGGQGTSHSLKTNTTILAKGTAPKAQGLPLEIVPLVDPLSLKMGDDLPVRVLYQGRPLSGVSLYPDYVNDGHAESGKTDADGRVTLFVRNDGLNVIGVSHSVPAPDHPDVDRVGLFATLSFTLPHGED